MDVLVDLDNISTLSAILLAAIGFGFAYWQILKTKNAAIAAREAISSTEHAIAKNKMLSLGPHLRRIALALDNAIDRDSAELVLLQFDEYRYHVAELRGALDELDLPDEDLRKRIQDSIGQLTVADAAIRKNSTGLQKRQLTCVPR